MIVSKWICFFVLIVLVILFGWRFSVCGYLLVIIFIKCRKFVFVGSICVDVVLEVDLNFVWILLN